MFRTHLVSLFSLGAGIVKKPIRSGTVVLTLSSPMGQCLHQLLQPQHQALHQVHHHLAAVTDSSLTLLPMHATTRGASQKMLRAIARNVAVVAISSPTRARVHTAWKIRKLF